MQTEAGKRLLDWVRGGMLVIPGEDAAYAVTSIEAEAATLDEERLARAVGIAWTIHLAAMQLEYETGVEMFDKAAIPAALAAAIAKAYREDTDERP